MEKVNLFIRLNDLFFLKVMERLIEGGKKVYLCSDCGYKEAADKIDILDDGAVRQKLACSLRHIDVLGHDGFKGSFSRDYSGEFYHREVKLWLSDADFMWTEGGRAADEKLSGEISAFCGRNNVTEINHICSVYQNCPAENRGLRIISDVIGKNAAKSRISAKIYITPLLLCDMQNGSVDPLERITDRLLDFTEWVKKRVPDYFKKNDLHVFSDEDCTLNALPQEIIADKITMRYGDDPETGIFSIMNSHDITYEALINEAAKYCNVGIKVTHDPQKLNFIDGLFQKNADYYFRYARNKPGFSENILKMLPDSFPVRENVSLDGDKIKASVKSRYNFLGRNMPLQKDKKTVVLGSGQKLTYYTAGSGEPIVIVNAFGARAEAWDRLVFDLSEHYYVIIWDIRGIFNDSIDVCDSTHFGLYSQVSDIERIIDNEKLSSVNLLAWCSGVKSAVIYAHNNRKKVKSLFIIAGDYAPYKGEETNPSKFRENIPLVSQLINGNERMLSIYMRLIFEGAFREPTVSDKIDSYFFEIVPDEYRNLLISMFQNKVYTMNFLKICIEYYNHDISGILRELALPVTLLAAEYDTVSSPGQSVWAHALLRNSKLYELPGSPHTMMLEREQDVLRHIRFHMRRAQGEAAV